MEAAIYTKYYGSFQPSPEEKSLAVIVYSYYLPPIFGLTLFLVFFDRGTRLCSASS